jgi:Outer membrane protein beta-barrel domain
VLSNGFEGSEGFNYNYKPGLQANTVLGYDINDKVSLRLEPGFANRGILIQGSENTKSRLDFNYLSVPVLFRYNLYKRFSIFVGPEYAYLLAAKSDALGSISDLKKSMMATMIWG